MNYFPRNSARTLKPFTKNDMISGGWYSEVISKDPSESFHPNCWNDFGVGVSLLKLRCCQIRCTPPLVMAESNNWPAEIDANECRNDFGGVNGYWFWRVGSSQMRHATKMILKHQNSIYVNGPKKWEMIFGYLLPPKSFTKVGVMFKGLCSQLWGGLWFAECGYNNKNKQLTNKSPTRS